ncbi:Hypothetical protein SMAX5B_007410 [Scophthalmus maximus]|uniref:Uncharacterized protein n=1 Tax=Scophthalmus maximus TaxID=52904 RepID=A0A2U9BNX1_SCOMX|nr:Hypothetical protein SMAX5B_007410 [Scophthalmus maximus]
MCCMDTGSAKSDKYSYMRKLLTFIFEDEVNIFAVHLNIIRQLHPISQPVGFSFSKVERGKSEGRE